MTDQDLLFDLVAAAEQDLEPLIRRACDDLYVDDQSRLTALGILLSHAWAAGAAAGLGNDRVARALDRDLRLDDGASAAAVAERVRPPVSVTDVLRGISARVGRTGGATSAAATRTEIAGELSVSADEISREGDDPDGPLGKAIELGYVEIHPTYRGYWRLTAAGTAALGA